jgi:hypothetical protein
MLADIALELTREPASAYPRCRKNGNTSVPSRVCTCGRDGCIARPTVDDVGNRRGAPDVTRRVVEPVRPDVARQPGTVAGVADHISPWQACYRSARLLGSKELRFVLSASGHIAALVNPPGNPKASYRVGGNEELDRDEWGCASRVAPRFVVARLCGVDGHPRR